MKNFPIPTYAEVSKQNKQYFDFFNNQLGSLPNLYAMMAHSSTALASYLHLHNHNQSLTITEKEVIGLVVSAVNESAYCLETHTMIARLNGLSNEQIKEIKTGAAKFDSRIHALAQLVYSIVATKGHPEEAQFELFFKAGYTNENLVDLFLLVGDTMITNLLTCSMQVPSDFTKMTTNFISGQSAAAGGCPLAGIESATAIRNTDG